MLLALPGVVLVLYAMRVRASVPDSSHDPMLLGMWMNLFAMAIFAAGFLFFAAALWWLLRTKTTAARRCVRCGVVLEPE